MEKVSQDKFNAILDSVDGGVVFGDGVFAEAKSVVEGALASIEGTFQRGHGWSRRCDAVVWRWVLCRG